MDDDYCFPNDACPCSSRKFLDISISTTNWLVQLRCNIFHRCGSIKLFNDWRSFGPLGDSYCRHLDVDPVCDVDLSCWTTLYPDSIYEAAECDRASKWRQFWTITIPMILPFLMLAILFRGIENFKMFDLLPSSQAVAPDHHRLTSINLKREAFEKWRTGYSSAYAVILFVTVFRLCLNLCESTE